MSSKSEKLLFSIPFIYTIFLCVLLMAQSWIITERINPVYPESIKKEYRRKSNINLKALRAHASACKGIAIGVALSCIFGKNTAFINNHFSMLCILLGFLCFSLSPFPLIISMPESVAYQGSASILGLLVVSIVGYQFIYKRYTKKIEQLKESGSSRVSASDFVGEETIELETPLKIFNRLNPPLEEITRSRTLSDPKVIKKIQEGMPRRQTLFVPEIRTQIQEGIPIITSSENQRSEMKKWSNSIRLPSSKTNSSDSGTDSKQKQQFVPKTLSDMKAELIEKLKQLVKVKKENPDYFNKANQFETLYAEKIGNTNLVDLSSIETDMMNEYRDVFKSEFSFPAWKDSITKAVGIDLKKDYGNVKADANFFKRDIFNQAMKQPNNLVRCYTERNIKPDDIETFEEFFNALKPKLIEVLKEVYILIDYIFENPNSSGETPQSRAGEFISKLPETYILFSDPPQQCSELNTKQIIVDYVKNMSNTQRQESFGVRPLVDWGKIENDNRH